MFLSVEFWKQRCPDVTIIASLTLCPEKQQKYVTATLHVYTMQEYVSLILVFCVKEFKDNTSLKSESFMQTMELIAIIKQHASFMSQTLCSHWFMSHKCQSMILFQYLETNSNIALLPRLLGYYNHVTSAFF